MLASMVIMNTLAKLGRGRGDAAKVGDLERMAALVKEADQDEERAGGDAMVQHLVDRAVEALLREGEDSEHDKSKVAHRRIRHQLLHVGLHHRDQRAINDADDGQRDDPAGALLRGAGKHRDTKAQQPVGAHFQHDGRQHDRAGCGRLDVRIGQARCAAGTAAP